ncbi:MAG: ribosome-associated translation inhibitor RaiA [Patescibacteria group bacterium]
MNILVHSKTLKITDGLRQYVMKQVLKLGKFSHKVTAVNVFLETVRTKAGVEQEASAQVHVMIPGKDVVTKSKAHDLYLAVSEAMKDASLSLRKRKEKWIDRRARRIHRRSSLLPISG